MYVIRIVCLVDCSVNTLSRPQLGIFCNTTEVSGGSLPVQSCFAKQLAGTTQELDFACHPSASMQPVVLHTLLSSPIYSLPRGDTYVPLAVWDVKPTSVLSIWTVIISNHERLLVFICGGRYK